MEMPQDKSTNKIQTANNTIIEAKKTAISLNSSDTLYAEIRDKNYNAISSSLSRTAKELQQAYEVSHNL